MPEIVAPKSIPVEVPSPAEEGSTSSVTMETHLFRGRCNLAESLALGVKRAGDPAVLTLLSVGCSDASETDSLLALYNKAGYKGRVVSTGYDINGLVVESARTGRHPVRWGFSDTVRIERDLREYGFEVSYEEIKKNRPLGDSGVRLVADATDLRSRHQVEFVQHDASEPLPFRGSADLICANNFLFWLPTERAMQVLVNLGEVLAKNGVLNIGMDGLMDESRRARAEALLDERFSLRPMAFGPETPPGIFVRD